MYQIKTTPTLNFRTRVKAVKSLDKHMHTWCAHCK
ncbi:MAG: hypothetical protein UV22_C0014G0008 [Parcubacteria group bacterium GW2011_GWA2_42_35]|nr:MAG: hypothetical protein UV22_C0014G0008 [Parcubacteria group bacterium GW2011_GWA2_42_35]